MGYSCQLVEQDDDDEGDDEGSMGRTKRTPSLVKVPISASKSVSLIIFSAKRRWSGGNFFNFIAHPLAIMSSSVSGRLKYSVASPTKCSVVSSPFLLLPDFLCGGGAGFEVGVASSPVGDVVSEPCSDCESTSRIGGCNKK